MAEKKQNQKENFFVRVGNFFVGLGRKIGKFFSDLVGELKKVTWTSKSEVIKSTELVLVMVIAIGVAIGVIDTAFSYLFGALAGLIG